MVQDYGLFIGGKWKKSEGKRFETRNPATGEVLATFPLATKEDLSDAVHAAKGAFEKWRKTPAPRRGELLLEAARIFRRKKEDLGRIVTTEMGKVIAEGRGDVQEVIDFYEYAAGEGRRMFGDTVPSELPNKMCLTVRMPVGPAGRFLHRRRGHGEACVRERGEEDDQGRPRAGRQESDPRDGRCGPRAPDGRRHVRRLWHGRSAMHRGFAAHRPSEDLRPGPRGPRRAGGEAADRESDR